MKTILVILTALVLAGCASSGEYRDYLTASHKGHELALTQQKPLVRIEAMPGQSITGLKSVEVYTPVQAPAVQQARPSEWAGVLNNAVGVAGTVLGIHYAGRAAIGLADSVGASANAGYAHVQAPGAVTTTSTNIGDNSGANSGNSGRIAGGDVIDSTHTPTVVTQPAPVVVEQPAPIIVTTGGQ